MILTIIIVAGALIGMGVIIAIASNDKDGAPTFMIIAGIIILLLTGFGYVRSIFNHANNLGVLREQDQVIHVHEQRVKELNDALNQMVPAGKQNNPISLNADSPIKAITDAIAKAQTDLAEARATKAQAMVSIAQRKAGPFKGIVEKYGEK